MCITNFWFHANSGNFNRFVLKCTRHMLNRSIVFITITFYVNFFIGKISNFVYPSPIGPSLSISISKYTYILTLEVFFLLKQKMWRNCSMPESNWLKISEGNCHNLWDGLPLLAVKNHLLSEFLVKKNLSSDIRNNKKETVLSEKFAMFYHPQLRIILLFLF